MRNPRYKRLPSTQSKTTKGSLVTIGQILLQKKLSITSTCGGSNLWLSENVAVTWMPHITAYFTILFGIEEHLNTLHHNIHELPSIYSNAAFIKGIRMYVYIQETLLMKAGRHSIYHPRYKGQAPELT